MPEMPEVQAQSERMTECLAGRSLLSFQLLSFASLKTFKPAPDDAVGAKVVEVARRGKYLLLNFDNGHSHVVHLMQGGRWRIDPQRSAKPRFGLARWVFSAGVEGAEVAWLLTEAGSERKAGIWAFDSDPLTVEPLAALGPEVTDLTPDSLALLLAANSKRIHGLLRNQRLFCGIGRLLANEILYEAKISPFANASKLSGTEIEGLQQAIVKVSQAALEHERSLEDIGKGADRPSKVHNRAGQNCPNCGDTIRSVSYRSYTVFYCPAEQTNGKVLSDNTTSKFLK